MSDIDTSIYNTDFGLEIPLVQLHIYRKDQAATIEASKPVRDLLLLLATLCFRGYTVPRPCLLARAKAHQSFFTFNAEQIRWMRCLMVTGDSASDYGDHATSKLLPLLLMLNQSLKRVSYFYLHHETDWTQVRRALAYIPDDFEGICELLCDQTVTVRKDFFSTSLLFDELPYAEYHDDHNMVQTTIIRLVVYLRACIQQRPTRRSRWVHEHHRVVHLGRSDCRCRTSEGLGDKNVQLALDKAWC